MKKFLLLINFLTITGILNAQELCGTSTPTNYQDYQAASMNSTYDEGVCINIYFHIVRETNGSGGINPNQLGNIVNNLNLYYNTFDIYFTNIGFDYINNSTYTQVTENEANSLGQLNNQSNAINYYIVDELWNVGSGFVTGTALSIPSNRLIIRRDRVLSSTSPHEVGHCLNLLHTFETYYCAEAINGSNCSSCGDLVCDTPADANLGNSNGYTPDLTNIMSYYSTRDHFTEGQSIRMKSAIMSNPLLQQVVGTSCSIPAVNGSETICNGSQTTYTLINGGNSVTWNVSSNLNVISSSNSSITVQPINSSTSGQGFIEAILSTQTIRKDIWIGKASGSLTGTSAVCVFEDYYYYCNVPGGHKPWYTYRWTMPNSSWQIYSPPNNNIILAGPSGSGANVSGQMIVEVNNGCGWSVVGGLIVYPSYNCSGNYSYYINPNPVTTGSFTIDVVKRNGNDDNLFNDFSIADDSDFSKEIAIEIHSITGNIIVPKKVLDNNLLVDTSKLRKGIYILIIYHNKQIIRKKIIVD